MSDLVLKAALDRIAADLSTTQKNVLVASWRRAAVLRIDPQKVPVVGSIQTAQALVKSRLAWEPGDTEHLAELTDLGSALAEHLAGQTHR